MKKFLLSLFFAAMGLMHVSWRNMDLWALPTMLTSDCAEQPVRQAGLFLEKRLWRAGLLFAFFYFFVTFHVKNGKIFVSVRFYC